MGCPCCIQYDNKKDSCVKIDININYINDNQKEEDDKNKNIKTKNNNYVNPSISISNVITKTESYEKQEDSNINKIKNNIKKQIFKENQLSLQLPTGKNNNFNITLIKDLEQHKKDNYSIYKSSSQVFLKKKAFEQLPFNGQQKYNSSSPKKSNEKLIQLGLNDSDDEMLSSTKGKTVEKTFISENNKNFTSSLSMPETKKKKSKKKIEILNEQFTDFQKQFLLNILTENEVINSEMNENIINKILNSIIYKKIRKKVKFFTEKDVNDDYYYIIEKGKLEYSYDDELYELYEGNGIGTKALLKYTKNNCYIKSLTRVYLFVLPLEQYKKISNEFLLEKTSIIKNCFLNNFLFSNIDIETQNAIAKISKIVNIEDKNCIVEEKNYIDSIYFVLEGNIICSFNNIIIKRLEKGDNFGETNLFYQIESLYSYIAENQTKLIQIKYKELKQILREENLNNLIMIILEKSIKENVYLKNYIHKDNLTKIFSTFSLKFYKNTIIIPQNQKKIIIPISGTIFKGMKNQTHLLNLNKKEFIKKGEMFLGCLTSNIVYNIMGDECIILESLWDKLLPYLSTLKFPELKVSIYDLIDILNQISLFNFLPPFKIFQLANQIKLKYYNPGEIILKNGPISNKFFYIKEGKIQIFINGKKVKKLTETQTFGDISSEKGSYSRKADFVSLTKIICFIIEKESYEQLFDDNELFQPLKKMLFLKDLTISLDSLYYIRDIGRGAYGNVYLVSDDKKYYAMKTVEMKYVTKNKSIDKYFINEKIISSNLDFPFIIHLINTYKTRDYLFFLMEFIDGITLRKKIEMKEKDNYDIEEIQFYGAILFSVLNYLQKQRIIHRDFKPDNIMIDTNGYLKVIDFGIACYLKNKDYTNTIIGTCHYMSPEVIEGKNYNFNCDYWSIGIILYEFFYGKVPFGYNIKEVNKIYKEILESKIHFPSNKYENFNNLILNLLDKNVKNRITNFKGIKAHKFFKNFNFENLMKFMIKPKFIPKETVKRISKDNLNLSFLRVMKNNNEQSSNDLSIKLNKPQIDDILLSF